MFISYKIDGSNFYVFLYKFNGSNEMEYTAEMLKYYNNKFYQFSQFCEFITVPWMKHLVGSIIRILIDYMDYIPLCAKLKSVLEVQREWQEICQILGKKKYCLQSF